MATLPREVLLEGVLPLLPACTLLRSRAVCRCGSVVACWRRSARARPDRATAACDYYGYGDRRGCACLVVAGLGPG